MNCLYLPILKWKQAEQNSLHSLPEDIPQHICPVIETRNYQRSTQELYQSIQHHWSNKPLFLDVANPDGLILNERTTLLNDMLNYIHETANPFLKICLWSRFINSPFSRQIVNQINRVGCDICLRVRVSPKRIGQDLPEELKSLDHLSLAEERITLLIDFSSETFSDQSYIPVIQRVISHVLSGFKGRIAIASGAFPKSRNLNKGFNVVPRDDLNGWLDLNDISDISFIYSDYTCHDPLWEDKSKDEKVGSGYTPPIMRYTSLTQWHVRKLTFPQESYESSRFILEDKERVLTCDCPGCYALKQRAKSSKLGPGNYPSHLTDGIIHHITTVIRRNLTP